MRPSLLAVLLAAAALPAGAQQRFTVAQVMSAPFASDLVAGAHGDVAWVSDAEGVRNVWVASPPEWRARQVTRYTEDDGQEIGDVVLTPDGRNELYVRGAGPHRAGERPNPALLPAGVEQAVWIAPVSGGAPRRLAEASRFALAPSGATIAFARQGQLWTLPLDSGASQTALGHVRGGIRDLSWSPDGAHLAFVSSRERHGFIGVWDVGAKRYRYLDPSPDDDAGPVWSPDGRSLAWIRTPTRSDEMIFVPERTGTPWSIRVADVASGTTRELWRARPGRGSVFRELDADEQLYWAGDAIVFPWERDGWLHLYAVPAAGGAARLLTPGAFEVENVALAPDRALVYYSSNQDDIDRRHLWHVSPDGAQPPVAETRGRDIEFHPVPLPGGGLALLHSDVRHPAAPAILTAGGFRYLGPDTLPPGFPIGALVEPKQVVFRASDGVEVHGQLFLPPDDHGGTRRPAIMFFHGGPPRQMLLGFHYSYYYNNSYRFNQYLASQGYVVLSVNYRSGIGYGLNFREALGRGAAGASEYRDVLAGARWLRGRADVDPARIGLWGGSYGGYLTAMGLARNSDLFAAGVDMHGVHDWNSGIRNFVPSYDSVRYARRANVAWRASPLASVATWRSPVLLIHGDDDRNVNFDETMRLVEALRARGVPFETLVFPDEIHDFLLHRDWVRAYEAAGEFFGRKLGAAPARQAARGAAGDSVRHRRGGDQR